MEDYLNQLKTLNEQVSNLKRIINRYELLIEIVLDDCCNEESDSYSFNETAQKDVVLYTKLKMDAECEINQLRKKREIVLSQKEIAEALNDSEVLSLYEAFSNQWSQAKNFTYLDESDRQYLIDLLRKKLSKIGITTKASDLDPNPKINLFVN